MNISMILGKSGLLFKKHSPEILVISGIGSLVTGGILACRATIKAQDVIANHEYKVESIERAKDLAETDPDTDYTEKDYKKDLTLMNVQTSVEFIKIYGPAVTLGVVGVVAILAGHNILRKRNVAIMAAYKAVEQGFREYRQRVVEELGEEKDHQFRYGVEKVEVEEIDGDGNIVKSTMDVVDPNKTSIYARFFDESCTQWTKTPEYNLTFLKCQQNYLNDVLKIRGHVFLNEVYAALGIPHSQAGAVVGWKLTKNGDNYIDFGMFDVSKKSSREFVNGQERSILLDFNVDGVIYDLLD